MNPPERDATELVILRRLTRADAEAIRHLVADRAIAEMTLSFPHPYPEGAAEQWVAKQQAEFEEGTGVSFAIIARADGEFVGCIGVTIERSHNRGEIGYWIGRPFWDRGYGTAALRLFLGYCFSDLDLHRVCAHHFLRNPVSGRVLEKAGLRREGLLREHLLKDDKYEDLVAYGLLREDHLGA